MGMETTDKKLTTEIEYLGIPYNHVDERVMIFRAEISDMICADLMKQGRLIYAPISSCHHIAEKHGLPRNWEFWQRMDEQFICICKKLLIVTLDGWETSIGLTAERKLAEKCGIPIEKIDPEPYITILKTRKEELYVVG